MQMKDISYQKSNMCNIKDVRKHTHTHKKRETHTRKKEHKLIRGKTKERITK